MDWLRKKWLWIVGIVAAILLFAIAFFPRRPSKPKIVEKVKAKVEKAKDKAKAEIRTIEKDAQERHEDVARARAIPDERERLEALAAVGRRHKERRRRRASALLLLLISQTAQTSPVFAQDISVVMEGELAPYSGILLSEEEYAELLHIDIDLEACAARERVLSLQLEETSKLYSDGLKKATEPPKFWQTPEFNRWLGFIGGIVITGAVVSISVKVTR